MHYLTEYDGINEYHLEIGDQINLFATKHSKLWLGANPDRH